MSASETYTAVRGFRGNINGKRDPYSEEHSPIDKIEHQDNKIEIGVGSEIRDNIKRQNSPGSLEIRLKKQLGGVQLLQ